MITPHAKHLGKFSSELAHPLSKEIMEEMELLDEELLTSWAPVVEEDG